MAELSTTILSYRFLFSLPLIYLFAFHKRQANWLDIKNKKFMIVGFLEGQSKKNLTPMECKIVGSQIAKLHQITKNFKFIRKNDLSVKSWRSIFSQVKDRCN